MDMILIRIDLWGGTNPEQPKTTVLYCKVLVVSWDECLVETGGYISTGQ